MATRSDRSASEGRGQKQEKQASAAGGGPNVASGTSGTSGTSGGTMEQGGRRAGNSDAPGATQTGGGARGSEQGAERMDQERQRSVSRETGVQTGTPGAAMARQQRQQQSMIPSLATVSPDLLAGAFLANPYEFMRRMNAEMDRVFEDAGFGRGMLGYPAPTVAGRGVTAGGRTSGARTGVVTSGGTYGASGAWMPQIETLQRDDSLVMRADLPGVDRNDIHVDVEDGVLTLSGERRQQHEERNEGVYRSERSYGSFYRAIPLPDDVDEDRIAATYENGVLEVVIPLPEQKAQRARKIEIR